MKGPFHNLSMRRLSSLWKKESLQWLRNPLLLIIFFSAVTIQVVLFGYSVNTRPFHLSLMILDQDQTPFSRELIAKLETGPSFKVKDAKEETDLTQALTQGNTQLALIIPSDFSENFLKNKALKLQIYLDGAQANTAILAKAYFLNRLRDFYLFDLANKTVQPNPSPAMNLDLRYKIFHNKNLQDSFFMVPGMIGAVLLLIVTVLSAVSFTREKEIGTLTGVQMSPISPFEFLVGKTVPLFFLSLLFTFLGFAAGSLWFKIPLSGSLLLLILGTFFFLITCIGCGFLAACFSRTQLQACMTTLFFTIPGIFLSGAMGQTDVWWPPFLRFLSWLNPLFYYVKLSRGVFIASVGWASGWPLLFALLFFMVLIIALTLSFSRRFFMESATGD